MALNFPDIDPVAVALGPVEIRWYALAYLAGFLIGWRYAMSLCRGGRFKTLTPEVIDDFFPWAILGVILGGRFGYVLFYNLPYYAAHPAEIVMVWQGGMAFHGGILGMTAAMLGYALIRKLSFFVLTDVIACVAPVGLFFGRFANFVNGELYGRAADVPWAVIFPGRGEVARHPSQIYEAFLEGAVLFLVLYLLSKRDAIVARKGALTAVFLLGYGTFRFCIEWVREPDVQIGLLPWGITMGQALSAPMVLLGLGLCVWAGMKTKTGKDI